jgi:hypothetical protein
MKKFPSYYREECNNRFAKRGWSWHITCVTTGKPQYNESEETKDFVLYSKDFVIAGAFYYKINYRGS